GAKGSRASRVLPFHLDDPRSTPRRNPGWGRWCERRFSARRASAITRAMADRSTGVRHAVVGWTLVLAAIAYLDRVCISTAAPAIRAELGLSDAEMGLVFSAFTLAYALFEVPSGWFADRFGARVTLARIVVWWSILTAATGLATGFASLVLVRFLFGLGEAG